MCIRDRAQDAIREEAQRCGMFYVNARWLGGMLTNFKTMRGRVDRLNQLKKMQEDGTFDMLPKLSLIHIFGEGFLFCRLWRPEPAPAHSEEPGGPHCHQNHRELSPSHHRVKGRGGEWNHCHSRFVIPQDVYKRQL